MKSQRGVRAQALLTAAGMQSFALALLLLSLGLTACGTRRHTGDPGPGPIPTLDSGTPPPNVDAGAWLGDPVTCEHARTERTYVGCDFWPTVLPNVVGTFFDYAVVVANAGENDGEVVVMREGAEVARGWVPARGLTTLYLPWVAELKHWNGACDLDSREGALDASKRVPGGAYQLTSTVPVTVYQFNPIEYRGAGGPPGKDWSECNSRCWPGCNSYSNDASLLLPEPAATGSYVITAESGIAQPSSDGMGFEIRQPAYVAVTGFATGTVDVRVGAGGRIVPGPGIAGGDAGDTFSFAISRGEVVLLVGTPETDLGGTLLHADVPVQVLTGLPCTYQPHDRQSCDHVEEVVFPVETLGTRYHVARPSRPDGGPVGQVVRLFGTADATTLEYPGGAPAGAPSSIDAGEVIDLGVVDVDFEIRGSAPFAVSVWELGQVIVDPGFGGDSGRGDPAQSNVAAVEQYRTRYVFLAPTDYDVSYAVIVAPVGAAVLMDGGSVGGAREPLGEGYEVIRVPLEPVRGGAHLLEANLPVGLQVMGFGFATSYQYPGGLDLRGIGPPLPDLI